MISVSREGEQVRLDFNIVVPMYEARTVIWLWNCDDNVYAGLLAETMQRQMHDKLESIQRAAYEAGWRDAKAKTTKRRYFRLGWRQM